MEIIVNQRLSAEDHYAYNMFHLTKKTKLMYFPYITGVIMIAVAVVAFIVSQDYLVAGFGALFALYSFVLYPKNLKRRIRTNIERNPKLQTPIELNLVLNEEGVKIIFGEDDTEESEDQPERPKESQMLWQDILEVVESDIHFYLYIAKNQAIIMTKASLSDEKIEESRQLFLSKIPQNKVRFLKN
jgi:hypothetical protein